MVEASNESPIVAYRVSPSLTNDDLNALLAAAWDDHTFQFRHGSRLLLLKPALCGYA